MLKLRNQVKGCLEFSDVEDFKRTLQNVCNIQILKVKKDVVNNEECYIIEYRKPGNKLYTFKCDSIKNRVEKSFNNVLNNIGLFIIKTSEVNALLNV